MWRSPRANRSACRWRSAARTSGCSLWRASTPAFAGAPGGPHCGPRGTDGLRHDAACQGTRHTPGACVLQYLYEPDPDSHRGYGPDGVARHVGPPRAGPALRPRHPLREGRLSAIPGVKPLVAAPVVREFALELPLPADLVIERMADEGFLAGLPVEVGDRRGLLCSDREAPRDRRLRGCHGKGRLVSGLGRKAAPGGKASSAPLLGHDEEPTIFDFSVPGRRSALFRTTGVPEWRAEELLPAGELRPEPPELAEISERDLVAHMTRLSHRQYSVDLGPTLSVLHDEVQPQGVRRGGGVAWPRLRAPGHAGAICPGMVGAPVGLDQRPVPHHGYGRGHPAASRRRRR